MTLVVKSVRVTDDLRERLKKAYSQGHSYADMTRVATKLNAWGWEVEPLNRTVFNAIALERRQRLSVKTQKSIEAVLERLGY